MRLEPQVARRKYDLEVQRALAQRDVLRHWGCWVADTTFPTVDVVLVPRHPLLVCFPHFLKPAEVEQPPYGVTNLALPALGARAFGVRVSLDDFDLRAPSVTFRDPWTWDLLAPETLPQGFYVGPDGKRWLVLLPKHPVSGLPFLCMRGIREYHEHPEHTNDDWFSVRGSFGLLATIETVWRTCIASVASTLFLQGPGVMMKWQLLAEDAKAEADAAVAEQGAA